MDVDLGLTDAIHGCNFHVHGFFLKKSTDLGTSLIRSCSLSDSLKSNSTLTTLDLGFNDIGCDSAPILKALKRNTTIKDVGLGDKLINLELSCNRGTFDHTYITEAV